MTLTEREADRSTLAEGFTKNAILATLYAGIVLQPMVIFSSLYGGLGLSTSVITILLLTQLGVLLGKKLNRHEVLVAYVASGISGSFVALPSFGVFLSYIRLSPSFSIGPLLPTWAVPPASSGALIERTFLHPDWIPFIGIYCFTFTLWYVANFILGVIAFQLYYEVEKLPFPTSRVGAETVIALSEPTPETMKYFTYTLFFGLLYGLIAYGFPIFGRALLRHEVVSFIPVPWMDLNKFVQETLHIEAGNFGIATSIGALATGFVIPFYIVLTSFLTSFAINLIITPFLYKQGLLPNVIPGADISYTWRMSFIDFWVGPSIGLAIALGIVPLLLHSDNIRKMFRSLKDLEKVYSESRYMRVTTLIIIYFICTLGTVAITLWLCPDFIPYAWIAVILSTVVPFILVMASARAIASAGTYVELPYLFEGIIGALPYKNVDIWFAPLYTSHTVTIGSPSAMWVDYLYMAKYTGTKITSLFKGWFFALPIAWFLGLIYYTAMWRLAPIPSSFYPYSAKTYPIMASYMDLFVSKRFVTVLDLKVITSAFLLGAIIYVVSDFLKYPGILVGVVGAVGVGSLIPLIVTTFVGALIGKVVAPKIFGSKENWERYKFIVTAGLMAGEGVAAGIAGLVNIVYSSMLTMPY